jgi:uncharacterized protein involved in exopolysaccharide biosynthesis
MSASREAPDLDAEAEVDLGRYGRSLLARWWLLLAGLVAGAVIGYLTTLGGTQFYRAQATVYMGQPLGIGSNPVQALNTNPSSVRVIVTSELVVRRVSARSGLSAKRIHSGTSVTAVQGYLSKLGQTPLIAVTVQGREPAKITKAANMLANAVVSNVGRQAREKIAILTGEKTSDDASISVINKALASSTLSSTDKLLLQLQLHNAQADLAQTAQLLSLAKNVEAPRIVIYGAPQKSSARNHRNSTAVGALIGLILGGIAALLWEPVTRARRRES